MKDIFVSPFVLSELEWGQIWVKISFYQDIFLMVICAVQILLQQALFFSGPNCCAIKFN